MIRGTNGEIESLCGRTKGKKFQRCFRGRFYGSIMRLGMELNFGTLWSFYFSSWIACGLSMFLYQGVLYFCIFVLSAMEFQFSKHLVYTLCTDY